VNTPQDFWRRRVLGLLLAQLRQGVTPERIALTLVLGAALAVFPILGSTTLLCAGAALWLRLNQPIIQLVNYFCYPLQIALLIPFYRLGLSIPQLMDRFRAGPGQFISDFAVIALGGIAAWCLLVPPAAALLYFACRPAIRKLALRNRVAT
jgi:uncharacterized protein (DUF2062 family)